MHEEDLNPAEAAVWTAFPRGESIDLTGWKNSQIRASVLRALLLDSQDPLPGELPALRVRGAHIVGVLELAYVNVRYPVSLQVCHFDERMDLYGARLRQFSLADSAFPGLTASTAHIDGNLRLAGCRSFDEITLVGAHITGALILDRASLEGKATALNGTRLTVDNDIIGHDGFTCEGQFDLKGAVIGGAIRFEGATLRAPTALSAMDITVGSIVNCCDGFRADGRISLSFANVRSRVCFHDARLSHLSAQHLRANELNLRTAQPIEGGVELQHARIGVIRDAPESWPASLSQDGLTYESLDPQLPAQERLAWLGRDAPALPHGYEQLATAYRRLGLDADARTVLLTRQRRRRTSLSPLARAWGHLQDAVVGYGYRPVRAAAWLLALLVAGGAFFAVNAPVAADAGPAFNAVMYTLDLLLPLIDFGQERAFTPAGAGQWVAFFLIAAGWILATTVAAGITRTLSRH